MSTQKRGSGQAKKDPIRLSRKNQFNQIQEVVASLETSLQECRDQRTQLTLLESVSQGLYDEIDKLTKKAPAESITDLALSQVNDVIKETKQLLDSDAYIQRLNEFVPAGDNPQHRDVVLVLRLIREGLDRFRQKLDPLESTTASRLNKANGVQVALQLYLKGKTTVTKDELEDRKVRLSDDWMKGPYSNKQFDFHRLDALEIPEYFTNVSFGNLEWDASMTQMLKRIKKGRL
jgi:DNA repair exonuclease SbcCD ATPase subunit